MKPGNPGRFFAALLALGLLAAWPAPAAPPERVVSLVPSQTEMLFRLGLGPLVIGISDHCSYPKEAQGLPRVGGQELNLERLAALRPTTVIDLEGAHRRYELFFRQVGWRYLNYSARTLEEIPRLAASLAADLGAPIAGQKFASQWENDLLALRKPASRRPRVYLEIWDSPPQAAGPNSFIGGLIRLAGGENVVDIESPDFPVVPLSLIVKKDPEFILLAYPTSSTTLVGTRPGWGDITAVRMQQVIILPEDLFLRPGPRCLEAVRYLSHLLN
ncbi:MAG: ABC transporter substrate-binding protein [Candidatus Riflebacteria bacterium]|nr:ABC transporter substrate-binding protein [Candidatus Riflebacteria bacterium]